MENGMQLVMELDCGIRIPEDSPVRLLNAVLERIDYSRLRAAYSRYGRIEYPPKILLKVIVYGYMRKEISSRKLEACCRENINYMYLLEGHRAPDHNTINRFRKNVLTTEAGQDILKQFIMMLYDSGLIRTEAVFIDGTKIEANANRYSFVWKKGVEKQVNKLYEQVHKELPGRLKALGIHFYVSEKIKLHELKKLRKKLYAKKKAQGIDFVSGKGKHKTPLQRVCEQVDMWIERLKKYISSLHICGDRNSYSKTDHEATFMRMKEDHMRNGQLKPGYNVNVATCNDFVIGSYISSDRSDVQTLIPFMTQLRETYSGLTFGSVVADSGYESEENYCWFEEQPETELYVKPANHEIQKSRKYRTDISRRENMSYDAEKDSYTCANGKTLTLSYEKHSRSSSGLPLTTSVYECQSCQECPLKEKCIRAASKKPLEERHKVIYVSKRFARQREEMEAKITSERGSLLRVNRSIQAEGTFAYIKEDLSFRRFLLRSRVKVGAEWLLFSLALNVLKLHYKIQNNRLGTELHSTAAFPAGL